MKSINAPVLPSHIKKSIDLLQALRKQLDLIIHIQDSRSPEASRSINIVKIFGPKKILTIYSKQDIAVPTNKPNTFNLKDHSSRRKILTLIKEELVQHYKEKNINCFPPSCIAVVGIPNVGKSTLINLLKQSKSSKNENSPGTTKNLTKYFIGDNIWLYDSPGILLPNLTNEENTKKLFLLNSLPLNNEHNLLFLEWAYTYLLNNYPETLIVLSGQTTDSYQLFLETIAKKFNLIRKDSCLSIDDAEKKFLLFIHSGKIGKIKWDNLPNL